MMQQQKLIASLKRKHLSLALAESVTAGYTSYLVTTVAGASSVFRGGMVVYSLEAKHKFFGLNLRHLEKTQGVSADIALVLAKKISKLLKSDLGGAVVGFAGPKARIGSKVGTIYIAVAAKGKNLVKKYIIKGSRDNVRKKAADLLIRLINKLLTNL